MHPQSCPTLCNPMDCSPPGSSGHGISQEWNTGVGCHFLFQGIFLKQGLNPRLLHLLHWQADSLPLAPPGKPLYMYVHTCTQTHTHTPFWNKKPRLENQKLRGLSGNG